MMSVPEKHRHERVTVSIEELVPADHFLRAADVIIDFSFIERISFPYYCDDNGRPSILSFALLFISK